MDQRQDQRHHLLLRLSTDALLWLAREADFQPIETGLNLLIVLWAGLLFFAHHLFGVGPVYEVMGAIARQSVWGLVAAVVVCWHCFSVSLWRPYPWTRSLALLAIFAWNCFFGIMFAATGIPSYLAGAHFIFASLAAWALWRYAGRPHA